MTTYTEKHREYYLKNRERIIAWQREKEKEWLKTPKGVYQR